MLQTFTLDELEDAARLLRRGGVLAYPTEAVFGLGCDPHDRAAFERIFALKQRPATQGVLLIAADFAQVERYIDLGKVPQAVLADVRDGYIDQATARAVYKVAITADFQIDDAETIVLRGR